MTSKNNPNNNEVRELHFRSLIPNIITIMAICCGLSSIRFALYDQWEVAVILVLAASFLDLVDGRVARYLNATSSFGAQLDSMADFANFGLAPGITLYLWFLDDLPYPQIGWGVALFYIICAIIRLARFNSDLDEDKPEWHDKFFVGVPAPAAAFLVYIPMMLSFNVIDLRDFLAPTIFALYILLISVLMVSKIPTFSTKKLVIKRQHISLTLVVVGLLIALVFMEPWVMLPVFGLLYFILIPFSIHAYNRISSTK